MEIKPVNNSVVKDIFLRTDARRWMRLRLQPIITTLHQITLLCENQLSADIGIVLRSETASVNTNTLTLTIPPPERHD